VPSKERASILAECEPVELVFGDLLYEADQPIEHIYFPLKGFISLVTLVDDREPLEMGLIGSEGMLGATLTLGVRAAPMRAVVQGAGTALRMSGARLIRTLKECPAMRRTLDRYLYVMFAQLTQSFACTRFHEIEPRLARWLLMTHDRAHADHFHLTHEFLAAMLGVRRSGISVAASALQERRIIGYSRGEISILDRKGLEGASCGCYAATIDDYANVFV
jgi:CRP-like cAMP-binding protein